MKIETKYNIGDRIWIVYENTTRDIKNNLVLTGEISLFDTTISEISVNNNGFEYYQEEGDFEGIEEKDIILYEDRKKLLATIYELMDKIHEREKGE